MTPGLRALAVLAASASLVACAVQRQQQFAPPAVAPPAAALPPRAPAELTVAQSDADAAHNARILSYHFMPLRKGAPRSRISDDHKIKYPADLVRRHGPIMTKAAAFNIYVNCKKGGENCWGDPEGFQKNLTGSRFASLLTQYTASPATGYTFGGAFSIEYHTYTNLLYANDLLTILHAAIVKNGGKAGYAVMYHIFLPKGTDTCFDRSRDCYSPDHPRSFDFCAYHESVAFADVSKNVIVSIEPYQDISFCASRASSGASALTNSTASTLVHETFESITDPGPAFAWFNFTFFEEVADLCETFQWKMNVSGTVYSLQPMYSNKYHACADKP
jgi:hypothetical protein